MDDYIKTKGRRKRIEVESAFQLVTEQFVSWAKWLNVSLFGINGAALLTLAASTDKLRENPSLAAPFAIGLFLALASGSLLQEYYSRAYPLIQKLRQYWLRVEDHGQRNIRFEKYIQRQLNKIQRFDWAPPTLGWASAAAFLVGILRFS